MKIIVKFSPEIIIKSRSIRFFFSKTLTKNIKEVLKNNHQLTTTVTCYWDYLEIIKNDNNYNKIFEILLNVPGIHHFLLVKNSLISSLEDIYNQVILQDFSKFMGKSFCVRIKRSGIHVYTSQDIERYLGYKLCSIIQDSYINLINPDNVINLEIKNNNLFIIIERYQGLGGLPIGTQQASLSLISGGFDSAVSSYMIIRRGCKVHYCFFNLSGSVTQTIEVYKIIYYLWNRFSCSHKVKVIVVDFSSIIKEISTKVKKNYIGMVLKRMMIRTANMISKYWKINSLVTGEVLGQVSSQTMHNLLLIDDAKCSDCIILRPLISYDKEHIIKLARKIGTEIFSRKIPEYCGMISKKSITKANKELLELEEKKIDISIINKLISQSYVTDVRNIHNFFSNYNSVSIMSETELYDNDVVLDIRTKFEQENNPLYFSNFIKIKKIPFYKLIDQFPCLDQNKVYLLYCEHGIMSRLQAIKLYEKGFRNVKIYRKQSLGKK